MSTCDRCGGEGHTRVACTPPPCTACGGVEAHITDQCPVYRRMARVELP